MFHTVHSSLLPNLKSNKERNWFVAILLLLLRCDDAVATIYHNMVRFYRYIVRVYLIVQVKVKSRHFYGVTDRQASAIRQDIFSIQYLPTYHYQYVNTCKRLRIRCNIWYLLASIIFRGSAEYHVAHNTVVTSICTILLARANRREKWFNLQITYHLQIRTNYAYSAVQYAYSYMYDSIEVRRTINKLID